MNQPAKVKISTNGNKISVSINEEPLENLISSYRFELGHEAGCLPVLHIWFPVIATEIEIDKCEVQKHAVDSST